MPHDLKTSPTIVALVPMRHHSERLGGKNYRSFGGKPLYQQILLSLLKCHIISTIVIDTDSEIIMKNIFREFPKIRIIERPDHLRSGTVPMNEVLLNDVTQIEADYYIQTHSTNPLLKTDTILNAINTFLKNRRHNDSLFSVSKMQVRLWDSNCKAINHDPSVLLRTQDLTPIYKENSCIYIFSRESLESNRNRIGRNPLMFEINSIEAWDIDDETDFKIAEILYENNILERDLLL